MVALAVVSAGLFGFVVGVALSSWAFLRLQVDQGGSEVTKSLQEYQGSVITTESKAAIFYPPEKWSDDYVTRS